MKLQKVINFLFAKGTLGSRALSIWQREGWQGMMKKTMLFAIIKARNYFELYLKKRPIQPEIKLIQNLAPTTGKYDVFCFPVINWDFRFQRPQQLLTQFSNDGHRVFYLRANFSGLNAWILNVKTISNNIYELFLPGDSTLALYRDDLIDPTLSWAFLALRKFIDEHKISKAVCLVHHPFWLPLVKLLMNNYKWKVIYDCMDDISAFEVTHKKMIAREKELLLESDLVVATSVGLHKRLEKINQKCILVPNGADFEHFAKILPRDESLLSKIPQPIIGYYGAISEWFDAETILHAAVYCPDWHFVLIGDTWGGNIKDLTGLPNIHLLGEKPYAELPSYLSGFDVAIIPFIRSPLTEVTNPVKVFEYLSGGKPVVATDLPELNRMKDFVFLYSTPNEFVSKIQEAMLSNNEGLIKKRQMFARRNTWRVRYQEIKVSIDLLFDH